MTFSRYFYTVMGSGILAFNSVALQAAVDTKNIQQQFLELEQQIQQYQKQIDRLEQRLDKTASSSISTMSLSKSSDALQFGLSALFSAGGSSANYDDLQSLQAGGHDPKKDGFSVQNVELSISGAVDQNFYGQTNIIILIDADGETVVELEEAFFTTRALPWGLQLKGGQYFTEFGRLNKQHPHTWDFVDQPVVLSRFFGGDGLRSQGLRASWLMPADWYSEFYIGMQNAKGETVTSFLSAEGEDIGGYALIDRRANGSGDLLYSARWLNGFDLSDNLSMNLGVSALWGPNASGDATDTRIVGTDLYMKWQPATSLRGYPFVAWHTELLQRHYEAGNFGDVLRDEGMFSQLLWGFKPGWIAGVRWDSAKADSDTSNDALRDTRKRLSLNLTWRPSEYSKLRLQYNRDETQYLAEKTADSIWLQLEFNLGSHKAHTF